MWSFPPSWLKYQFVTNAKDKFGDVLIKLRNFRSSNEVRIHDVKSKAEELEQVFNLIPAKRNVPKVGDVNFHITM